MITLNQLIVAQNLSWQAGITLSLGITAEALFLLCGLFIPIYFFFYLV